MSTDSIWCESSVIWLNLRWLKCHLTQSVVSQVSSDSIWGESSVIWLNLWWVKCHLTQSEVSQMSSGSILGESSVMWLNLMWVKCHLTQSEVSQVSSDSIWGQSSVIWLNLRWLKCHLTLFYLFIYYVIFTQEYPKCAALFSLGLLHYMHDKTNINQHTFSYNTVTTVTTWYIHHYMHNVNYVYMFLITVVTCRCRFMFGQHYVQCIWLMWHLIFLTPQVPEMLFGFTFKIFILFNWL